MTSGEAESTLFLGVTLVKVPGNYKIGVLFATAVGSDVTFAFRIGVIVAALTDFCLAGILLAERATRVKVHPLRKSFLFR